MNCVILPAPTAATASIASAAPANCDHAARFSELMQTEPSREVMYVDGPAHGSGTNPIMRAVAEFQSTEYKLPELHSREDAGSQYGDREYTELDLMAEAGNNALLVQAQILRTTLMMETVSSAKQGVTTLFQQQG